MRFFLIDRITEWNVGAGASAIKNVALSEDFFDDHFPRRPVMPGVLILEGMAQLSGLLLEVSLQQRFGRQGKAVLTVVERTKFRQMVRPGDCLTYRCRIRNLSELGGKVEVEATRESQSAEGGAQVVATSGMVFGFKEVVDPKLDEKRQELLRMWMA